MRHAPLSSVHAYPWRQQLLCLAPAAVMLVILALAVGTGPAVTRFFQQARLDFPRLENALALFTDKAALFFYAVWAIVIIKGAFQGNRRRLRFGLVLTAVLLFVSLGLVDPIKSVVGSPRPSASLEGAAAMPFSGDDAFESFPSGHVAHFTALLLPLLFLRPRFDAALWLGLLIAIMAFTRIFLGRHHMADVAGGLGIGLFAAFIIHHLCRRDLP